MRANAGILIIICLLLLVGTGVAYLPDKITFTSNPEWVIANGGDQSTITVTIKNQSYNMVLSSSNVIFNSDSLGTMLPMSTITNLNGEATSNFKVKTKSGNATITVFVTNGSDSNTLTIYQNIDHDKAYYDFSISPPIFTYPEEGPVNKTVPFNVSIYDKWGNPVDNRNPKYVHNVSLHVSSALTPNDCYFNVTGNKQDISIPLDSKGTLSVDVKLTTKSGTNKILMDNFEDKISNQIAWISAISDGNPYSITGGITCVAAGGFCTANNFDYYIIDYFLFDEYGNPVRNRSVWVNTTPTNEQKKYTSNSLGQIELHYGPVVTADDIIIDATSIDPPFVTNRTIAHFVNSTPTNMILAVTPQNMASREVKPESVAYVRATVIDLFGNPVPGQEVRFDITAISTGGFNVSVPNGTPSFDSSAVVSTINATTDPDGNAIVLFYPGSFARLTDPGFAYMASGSCTVKAQWSSTTRTSQVSWKNYPFLSVEAIATPQTVSLNGTFDVSINVTGDGYAMPGGGVTAVLDQDCSASMKNPDNNGYDRLWNSKEAAKVFVDTLGYGSFIGLISYGDENNDQFHLAPQVDPDFIKTKIDSLLQGTKSKDLGPSITEAMHNITVTQSYRPLDKVRAVIVLNDGNSNLQNQGEMDALVGYATSQNPKIFIFTVLYLDPPTKPPTSQNIKQMGELANRTGGVMYIPTSPEDMKNVYIGIALNLSKLAGVNATMQINYQTFEVDSQPMPGNIVFDYVPVGPFSTLQSTINPDGRTSILWPNSSQSVVDQTSEWEANQQLHFNIGTLNISDQWQTTYRLKANQTGLIKLFDNTSSVSFNDGHDILKFPDLYITVTPNATPQQSQGVLDIWNLNVTKSGKITDYAPLEWNFLYTGFSTATETISYSYNNGPWVQYDSRSGIAPANYTHIGQLDVREFPPGSYRIKVHGVAPDSNDDTETTEFMVYKNISTVIILR